MAEVFSQIPKRVHQNETLAKLLANENSTSSSQEELDIKEDFSPPQMLENGEISKGNSLHNEEHSACEPYDLSTHNNSGTNSPRDLNQEAENRESIHEEQDQELMVEDQKIHNDSTTTPNYGNGMLANLNELRHKRLLCDVIIRVGEQDYYAHKAVLASCSKYFSEKLLSGFQNKESVAVLEIDSVSPKGIELLLDFVYTGETLINKSTLYDLKQVAELTQIEKLIGICNRYQTVDSNNNNNYKFATEVFLDNDYTDTSPPTKLSSEEPKDLTTTSKDTRGFKNIDLEPSKQRRISEPVLPRFQSTILDKQRRSSLSYHKFKFGENYQESNDDQHDHKGDNKPLFHKTFSPSYPATYLKKYQFFAKQNDLNQDVFITENKNIGSTSPSPPKKESLSFSADKLLADTNRTTTDHPNHFLSDWEKQFSYGFANRFNFNQQLQDWIRPIPTNPLMKPMFNASPTIMGCHENPWTNMFRNRLAQANFPHFNREAFPWYEGIFAPGSKRTSPFSLPIPTQTFSPATQQRKERHMSSIKEQSDESPSSFPRFIEAKKAKFDRLHSHPPTSTSTRYTNHKSVSQDNDIYLNAEKIRSPENIKTDKKQLNKRPVTCKPYKCPLCEANFNRPANLKTHMRIHSGEKPYKCDTCGARFVQVAHLRAHVLIHTGEKPYPCNICGTSFRHLQTLKSHLRIHTGEKPYSCEQCCVKFRHKSQLRLHLRTKHGIQTNTKKTYKQVPGLCSADICAHIKRAQEVAKCQNKGTDVIGRGRSEKLTGNTRAFVNLMDVSTLSYSNNDLKSTENQYERNSDDVASPESMHEESNFTIDANRHLPQTSNNHHFNAQIPTAQMG